MANSDMITKPKFISNLNSKWKQVTVWLLVSEASVLQQIRSSQSVPGFAESEYF